MFTHWARGLFSLHDDHDDSKVCVCGGDLRDNIEFASDAILVLLSPAWVLFSHRVARDELT